MRASKEEEEEEESFRGFQGRHSLGCGFYAGFFLGAPHTAQTSGVGTHLAAGIKPAAFSRDLSQGQGAAHQSASLETRDKQRVCVKESGLYEGRVACQFFLPRAIRCCLWAPVRGTEGFPAARWCSGPRQPPDAAPHGLNRQKTKNGAKLSCFFFHFLVLLPIPYLFRGATVPPCGLLASQPAWCM